MTRARGGTSLAADFLSGYPPDLASDDLLDGPTFEDDIVPCRSIEVLGKSSLLDGVAFRPGKGWGSNPPTPQKSTWKPTNARRRAGERQG